jgi:hypothetical protein
MTEEQEAQRRYALAISGGVCEVCGLPLPDYCGANNTAARKRKQHGRVRKANRGGARISGAIINHITGVKGNEYIKFI